MASSPITSWQIDRETMETVTDFIFLGSKIATDGDCSHEIKRYLLPGRKAVTNPAGTLKSRDITLPTEVRIRKAMVFPGVMYGCESWTIKKAPRNWCLWTVVLEKTLENPLDCKEIKPINAKGNQPWIFIGKTDAEAEAAILWLPDAKSRLIGNDPDAEKDWRRDEKGTTENCMVGWHHGLNGHEFEQTLGHSGRQGSLVCCSPWGHRESEATEQLNNNITN